MLNFSSKYVSLDDNFPMNNVDRVLDEVKQNSKVKFKESDLFRVYQSIDLGNLDPKDTSMCEKMPNLMKLRETLYCSEYRSFIEQITSLEKGTLTDKVDCAVNCHTPGCHLLCHDDVIGTRKVSYILYLTDREPEWKNEDGGRLELYESEIDEHSHSSTNGKNQSEMQRRVPKPIPAKTILPTFNSMAFFAVEPGFSFHSVQEVFGDRPRLSIQGKFDMYVLQYSFYSRHSNNSTYMFLFIFGFQICYLIFI